MRKRFLSIEIVTYWHGSQLTPSTKTIPAPNPAPNNVPTSTKSFMLRTLAAGVILGALWGMRKIGRSRTNPSPEIIALQKAQERDERTNRWLNEIEQSMSDQSSTE